MLYGEFKSRFKKESEELPINYEIEDLRRKVELKPKSKKTGFFKKAFIFLMVIVIILCSTLLACDFLLPDGISTLISLFEKDAQYYYTLIWGSYDSLETAKVQADGLKLQGGAGYIYYDGKYNVFLSYYPDKASAETVAIKGNYSIYPILKSTFKATDASLSTKDYVKELIGIEEEVLNELYSISASLEDGTSVTDCANNIEKLSTSLENKCKSLFTLDTTNAKTIKFRQALKLTLSVLNNLSKDRITTTYLSDIREATILIALTFSGT